MCQLDNAQALETLALELALKAQSTKANFNRPSLSHCVDCDLAIPAARRAIGGVTRCIGCQTDFERYQL